MLSKQFNFSTSKIVELTIAGPLRISLNELLNDSKALPDGIQVNAEGNRIALGDVVLCSVTSKIWSHCYCVTWIPRKIL